MSENEKIIKDAKMRLRCEEELALLWRKRLGTGEWFPVSQAWPFLRVGEKVILWDPFSSTKSYEFSEVVVGHPNGCVQDAGYDVNGNYARIYFRFPKDKTSSQWSKHEHSVIPFLQVKLIKGKGKKRKKIEQDEWAGKDLLERRDDGVNSRLSATYKKGYRHE